MNRFDIKEIEKLEKIKNEIVSKCKVKCSGFGYEPGGCECFQLFKYIKELYYSKIPKDYWLLELNSLDVKNIYKRFAKKYIINLDNVVENGLGMILCGVKRGIGKTSILSIIGKKAIIKGFKVFYVIAQNIIDDRFTEEQDILDRIKECDLLLVDELDKVVMKTESNIPKLLENLLRDLLPNKKPIILATNFTEEEVEERFNIISLIKRYMKIIPMDGKDFSDKLAEKWDKRLENKDVDYNDKMLKKESKKYFENNREDFK